MAWLPDGEIILKTCLFVLTEFTNVRNTQTHTHRHRMTAYAALMHSIARQKLSFCAVFNEHKGCLLRVGAVGPAILEGLQQQCRHLVPNGEIVPSICP